MRAGEAIRMMWSILTYPLVNTSVFLILISKPNLLTLVIAEPYIMYRSFIVPLYLTSPETSSCRLHGQDIYQYRLNVLH